MQYLKDVVEDDVLFTKVISKFKPVTLKIGFIYRWHFTSYNKGRVFKWTGECLFLQFILYLISEEDYLISEEDYHLSLDN